jgi:hypothetical protein
MELSWPHSIVATRANDNIACRHARKMKSITVRALHADRAGVSSRIMDRFRSDEGSKHKERANATAQCGC